MQNKVWKLIAITGILMGVLTTFTPFNLAHVCTGTMELASGLFMPMKCNWTGRAEVVLGLLTATVGIIMLFARGEASKALGVVLGVLGVGIMILPTKLGIGICMNPEMDCHTTATFLNIWGGILVVLSLVSVFFPGNFSEAKQN